MSGDCLVEHWAVVPEVVSDPHIHKVVRLFLDEGLADRMWTSGDGYDDEKGDAN